MSEEIKDTVNPTPVENEPKDETPKIDYEAELAKAMAEIKKLKAASDRNASEAADYRKKWKATLDENQQAQLAKDEAEKAMREELEALRRESAVSKHEKAFLAIGYSAELAAQAAQATVEGNADALISTQKAFIEAERKKVMAEMTKSMPTPPISNGATALVTKEQFENMTMFERAELYQKDKALYESLVK